MLEQSLPGSKPLTRITILQGQARVSAGPRVEFSTVLGSCVATCFYDPEVELGGMNHFLLAEPPHGHSPAAVDEHYGVYLMEVLINEMLAYGAAKHRLRAHLYGGANMRAGMAQIGTMNAEFARRFLQQERIPLLREDLGGTSARRVEFRPAHGQVRCRTVANTLVTEIGPTPRKPDASGDVELF
ncbi:chemotaxis protein CheD [Altererythrobacter lauratis]|uniref:Probable chemoreceptor glutamine deamidase CheD n=1 Tax=Alteraurantiacibacter lauratis TaxID=2054627 RepID=A0ABV7EGF1_9SPHN